MNTETTTRTTSCICYRLNRRDSDARWTTLATREGASPESVDGLRCITELVRHDSQCPNYPHGMGREETGRFIAGALAKHGRPDEGWSLVYAPGGRFSFLIGRGSPAKFASVPDMETQIELAYNDFRTGAGDVEG